MKRERVEVTIVGAEVNPEQVPLKDLVDVLTSIDRVIQSYLAAELDELPGGALLSLVGIRPGSENLVFSTQASVLPAWSVITGALDMGEIDSLPSETHRELWSFSQSLERRKWELSIHEDLELGICQATLGVNAKLQPPAEPVIIQGTTSLHGRCLRVGGAIRPKAEVRLSATNQILHVELTEDVAKDLAKRLYEEVVLEGKATWYAETWEIKKFRVTDVTAYRARDPQDAFNELLKVSEGQWDGVDAPAFVESLRGVG